MRFNRMLKLYCFAGGLFFTIILGIIHHQTTTQLHKNAQVGNPHQYSYIINPASICKSLDVYLLIYVHSPPHSYGLRMIIRKTWGNVKRYGDDDNAHGVVRLVFIIGRPKSADDSIKQNSIVKESKHYNDIVQEDFSDTHHNLSHKAVAGLEWVTKFCRHARFVMKVGEDTVVDLARWLAVLCKDYPEKRTGLMMCNLISDMKVPPNGKWKVDESDWSHNTLPPFCQGHTYTMTSDVVESLYVMSHLHSPPLPLPASLQDVYVTGILPFHLGDVTHQAYNSYYYNEHCGLFVADKCKGCTYTFVHCVGNTRHLVWEAFLSEKEEQGVQVVII